MCRSAKDLHESGVRPALGLVEAKAHGHPDLKARSRPPKKDASGRPGPASGRRQARRCRLVAARESVRSTQEGGKEAGGTFTTCSSPDRSDKEEGSSRLRGTELTAPQTDEALQLSPPSLQPRGRKKWSLRPLLVIVERQSSGEVKARALGIRAGWRK